MDHHHVWAVWLPSWIGKKKKKKKGFGFTLFGCDGWDSFFLLSVARRDRIGVNHSRGYE